MKTEWLWDGMTGGKQGAEPFLISSSVAPHHTASFLSSGLLSPEIKHQPCI